MPDALPPVGVLLATLDAATLPLAGTEEAFVMQGGQPKRTLVSNIGSGGASHGAYTPVVTANVGITVVDPVTTWDFDPGFYTRIGGASPATGDIVTLHAWLAAANEGAEPLTATLTATLPAGMPFAGEGALGQCLSFDTSGDDPWDGPPWNLVGVFPGELRARFELAAGAYSARLVIVSYSMGTP